MPNSVAVGSISIGHLLMHGIHQPLPEPLYWSMYGRMMNEQFTKGKSCVREIEDTVRATKILVLTLVIGGLRKLID